VPRKTKKSTVGPFPEEKCGKRLSTPEKKGRLRTIQLDERRTI
jgi:hypothetical protein